MVELLVSDMKKICRACLSTKIETFQSIYETPNLLDQYTDCISQKVEKNDGLPMNLCDKCVGKCISLYTFKQLCKQTEILLRTKQKDFKFGNQSIVEIKKQSNNDKIDIVNDFEESENDFKDENLLSFSQVENIIDFDGDIKLKYEQIEFLDVEYNNPIKIENINTELTIPNRDVMAQNKNKKKKSKLIDNKNSLNELTNFTNENSQEKKNSSNMFVPSMQFEHNSRKKRFSCDLCGKSFLSKCLIRAHILRHTNIKPFKCTYCNKAFNHKPHLRTHLRTHTPEAQYLCTKCGKEFRSLTGWSCHMKFHMGEFPFCCDICGKSYTRKNYLKSHILRRHTTKPFTFYQCDVCDNLFKSKFSIHLHLKTHFRKYRCDKCTESYNCPKLLETHLKRYHVDGNPGFVCNICNKKFVNKKGLTIHKKTHEDNGYAPSYICKFCNITFSIKQEMKNHIHVNHPRETKYEKLYRCTICCKSFNFKHVLSSHLATHTSERLFSCKICQKSFKRQIDVGVHVRTVHTEKSFECKLCNKSYKTKSCLGKHLRKHNGEKNYQCTYCERKFFYSNHLERHILTHTGEKPFSCTMCDKKFANTFNCKLHILTHTGEKPFSCTMCDKSFKLNSMLTKHKQKEHFE